jgi:hypothetical protein
MGVMIISRAVSSAEPPVLPPETLPTRSFTARYAVGYTQQGNSVIVYGGYGGVNLALVDKIDLATNTCYQLPDLPAPTGVYGGTAFNDPMTGATYYIHGRTGTSGGGGLLGLHTYKRVYDTGSFTQLPAGSDFSRPQRYLTAYNTPVINGKAYCLGGLDNIPEVPPMYKDDMCCFDIATETWSTKTPYTVGAVQSPHTFTDGTYLYAFGGASPSVLNAGRKYNPATDSYTVLTAMLYPRYGSGCVYYPPTNKAYFVGGYDNDYRGTMLEYDVAGNSWAEKAAIPGGVTFFQGAIGVYGTRIYIIGGYRNGTWSNKTNTYYDVSNNTWYNY